jgi:hypothetical protein
MKEFTGELVIRNSSVLCSRNELHTENSERSRRVTDALGPDVIREKCTLPFRDGKSLRIIFVAKLRNPLRVFETSQAALPR